ncbi:hypothetical protein AMELA_G00266880 [Ameiurus melas]|uniref:Uncharacterized protein n=1 Tax=Ameiurus melas TaxID=219545 RepID=A0A7J5ZRF7_AMEME|nr:hypothetical protein AMELA_G00266880 [Ameiurus melas]
MYKGYLLVFLDFCFLFTTTLSAYPSLWCLFDRLTIAWITTTSFETPLIHVNHRTPASTSVSTKIQLSQV